MATSVTSNAHAETSARILRPALLLFGFLTVLLTAIMVARGTEFVASQMIVDDTFYYLQCAYNHVRLGFPSFDGETSTNGVQLLWYLVCVALAAVFQTKESLLDAAILTAAVLHASAFWFIGRIARQVGSSMLGLVAGAVWFAYGISSRMPFSGMENAVHALLLWWLLSEVVKLLLRPTERQSLVPFAIAATLVVWARLDSVSYVIPIAGFTWWQLRSWVRPKDLAVPMAIAAAGAIGFVALMYSWAGLWMPVSGKVKTAGIYMFQNEGPLVKGPKVLTSLYPRAGHLLLPGLAFVAALVVFTLNRKARNPVASRLAVASALGAGFYALFMTFANNTAFQRWYFSIAYIAFAVLVGFGLSHAQVVWQRAVAYVVAGLFVLTGGGEWYRHYTAAIPNDSLFNVRYRFAQHVNQTLPPDAVVASWNAGQLGYFVDRRLYNLDGLVNSKEFFEEVLLGKKLLSTYLKDKNITFLLDYRDQTPDEALKAVPIIYRVPYVDEGKNRELMIYDVRGAGTAWTGGDYSIRNVPKRRD